MSKFDAAKPTDVYLISSTLHFFWAFMLANKQSENRQSYLIAIDQYDDRPLTMLKYLRSMDSVFTDIYELNGRGLKGLDKLQNRRQQFDWIKKFVNNQPVNRVFIGNDRSVIGQYFIKQTKLKNIEAQACYMDDGVYSYLGRSASKKLSEKIVDALLKKLAYGWWYDVPETVGASKWIDEAWVMYPELVSSALKRKKAVKILPNNDGFKALKPLSESVFKGSGVNLQTLSELDVLITLPNETVFSQIEGYTSAIRQFVSAQIAQGTKVAVKYHPAAGAKDLLKLEKLGALKLPAELSFELFIPYLNNCLVFGDFSTTLLTSQYSQSLDVSILNTGANFKNSMFDLCKNTHIKVINL